MKHRFATCKDAHDAGYRSVDGRDYDITPGGGRGMVFATEDGYCTVIVTLTTTSRLGELPPRYIPMFPPAISTVTQKALAE